jgi:molybdopterin-guanine dinucleotide biosynthesis protein A
VPIVDGQWRPLPAALRTAAGPVLAEAFAEGERAVHRALERLDFVTVDVGVLTDADTPKDLPDHR